MKTIASFFLALAVLAFAACPAAAQAPRTAYTGADGKALVLVTPATPLPVARDPAGGEETATSGNVANATVAATLATAAGKTTYITGLHMASNGATSALAVDCTITGIVTGTQTFTYVYGALNTYDARDINFSTPMPASAANTTIVASCPASGTGGTHASMNLEGFQY